MAVAVEIKFVPLIVSVKFAPPAVAVFGLRLAIVGAGGPTIKATASEASLAVATLIFAIPALAIRAAGTAAVNCVELT
jgi:hypothetical protein